MDDLEKLRALQTEYGVRAGWLAQRGKQPKQVLVRAFSEPEEKVRLTVEGYGPDQGEEVQLVMSHRQLLELLSEPQDIDPGGVPPEIA